MIGAACLVLGFLFPAAAERGGGGDIVPLRIAALALLQGWAKAVRVSPGLNDAGAVGNAIDQRLAEPCIGNHLRPFRERQVGSNDHCGLLGPFGNGLEQELRTDFSQGYVAYFIEREEVATRPTAQRAAE